MGWHVERARQGSFRVGDLEFVSYGKAGGCGLGFSLQLWRLRKFYVVCTLKVISVIACRKLCLSINPSPSSDSLPSPLPLEGFTSTLTPNRKHTP